MHERGGALEIAIARDHDRDESPGDLVWRVRILDVSDTEILVEPPTTLGQAIHLVPGVELVAVLAIGQNRWMFRTTIVDSVDHRTRDGRIIKANRIVIPEKVERCQRRNYYRVETTSLRLPEVDIWPLLDPKTVLIAERANEIQAESGDDYPAADEPASDFVMPDVGSQFKAMLLNIGGGGLGLRVEPSDAQSLTRHKNFWVKCSLPPVLDVPICATAKLMHTHIDSTQFTYAGLAFDFSFNPAHQRFVAEQICRYIAEQQRRQMEQTGAAVARKSA